MDNYHIISITNCLTICKGFHYTDINRSDHAGTKKTAAKGMVLSVD